MENKVCHITSAHSRYDVRIFSKQCKSLVKGGYDVTLIVNDDKDDEVINGVKIVSTRYKPKTRMDRFIKSKKKLYDKAVEVDADIYQLHDPDLLPIGTKLKNMGKKIIFDSHEDIPKQIKGKDWIPAIMRNTVSNAYGVYEKLSVKRYDAVITVTPHIMDRLRIINSNIVMITNYPIIKEKENITRKSNNSICFVGGIGEQWSHDKILEAIEDIEHIKYILAGKGSEDYINLLKSYNSWCKVDYLGVIPHEEVRQIYDNSFVGMTILRHDTQVGEEGTLGNTKLFEYMEAGLPVICSNNKLWKEIINKYNCGIAINPNRVEEIKEAILVLKNNPDKAKIMGENGRKAIEEEYNWSTQEKKLLLLYENL